MNKNIFSLIGGVLSVIFMMACTNGIEPLPGNDNRTLKLAKNPDVTAWSGRQTLTSGFPSTRADEAGSYVYDFPPDIDNYENIRVPDGAISYTQQSDYKNDGDIYYIPAGEYPNGIYFPDNKHITLYIEEGAKIKNLGGNGLNMDIYICQGAEVTFDWSPSSGSWNFYNNGTLNFPGGVSTNVQAIYNVGLDAKLYIGNENANGMTINSGIGIYNKGGYVEINSAVNSETMVNTSIISDNIVKAKGNIKLQSNGNRDICHFIIEGNLLVIDGSNTCGWIECNDLTIQARTLYFQPEGYIKLRNDLYLWDGGKIYLTKLNSRGLVECKMLHTRNMEPKDGIGDNIFLNTTQIDNKGNIISSEEGLNALLPDRINKITANDVHPSCGNQDEPDDPEPEVPQPESEVEVNLAINDEHIYNGLNIHDLVAKLSIHVRYAGNVEIIIPMDEKWYCAQDDLYILETHEPGYFNHGGPTILTYSVGQYPVTLNFKYENNSIRIYTENINSGVFEFCKERNGDGINFEIYMYMNESVPFDKYGFDSILSRSTIEFTDAAVVGYPDYYINAFTDHGEGGPWTWDCDVKIVGSQEENFKNCGIAEHLNESSYNIIYKRDGFEGPDGKHKHAFLWGIDED